MTTDERQRRFLDLYREHLPTVLGYCRRRSSTTSSADDLAADVFAVAWRRLDDIPAGFELAWLLRTAHFTLLSERRTDRRRDALVDRCGRLLPAELPREPDETVVIRDTVARAMSQLGSTDREAIILTAWDGLSQRDAAAVLGVSENALALRLSRARRQLRRILTSPEPEWHVPGDPLTVPERSLP